jgi:hypothetical protein
MEAKDIHIQEMLPRWAAFPGCGSPGSGGGGGSTNSVGDRGQRERGSGAVAP